MDFTPYARAILSHRVKAAESWTGHTRDVQLEELRRLLRALRSTKWGAEKGLGEARSYDDFRQALPTPVGYPELRPYVMRMIKGRRMSSGRAPHIISPSHLAPPTAKASISPSPASHSTAPTTVAEAT